MSQSTQCGVNTKVVVQYSSCSDISKFSPANAGWAVVSWLRRCCWLFQWDVSVVILSYHNDLIPWEIKEDFKHSGQRCAHEQQVGSKCGVGTVEVTVRSWCLAERCLWR